MDSNFPPINLAMVQVQGDLRSQQGADPIDWDLLTAPFAQSFLPTAPFSSEFLASLVNAGDSVALPPQDFRPFGMQTSPGPRYSSPPPCCGAAITDCADVNCPQQQACTQQLHCDDQHCLYPFATYNQQHQQQHCDPRLHCGQQQQQHCTDQSHGVCYVDEPCYDEACTQQGAAAPAGTVCCYDEACTANLGGQHLYVDEPCNDPFCSAATNPCTDANCLVPPAAMPPDTTLASTPSSVPLRTPQLPASEFDFNFYASLSQFGDILELDWPQHEQNQNQNIQEPKIEEPGPPLKKRRTRAKKTAAEETIISPLPEHLDIPQPQESSPKLADGVEQEQPAIPMGVTDQYTCSWLTEDGHICGKVLESNTDLQEHCKSQHLPQLVKIPRQDNENGEGFKCLWNGCKRCKLFSQKSKLERHLQTHTGFKPVKCPHCGLQLSAKQSLEQHLRTHTGEKPWKCKHKGCNQSFKQQSALTMHQRTHTGEKPLHCEICNKAFSESSNLSKHRRTHNKKGGFVCSLCGKDFHRQDQLRRHVNTNHEK